MAAGSAGMLLSISPSLSIITLSVIPATVLGAGAYSRVVKRLSRELLNHLASSTQVGGYHHFVHVTRIMEINQSTMHGCMRPNNNTPYTGGGGTLRADPRGPALRRGGAREGALRVRAYVRPLLCCLGCGFVLSYVLRFWSINSTGGGLRIIQLNTHQPHASVCLSRRIIDESMGLARRLAKSEGSYVAAVYSVSNFALIGVLFMGAGKGVDGGIELCLVVSWLLTVHPP